MTWGEFKRRMGEAGVEDDMQINFLDVSEKDWADLRIDVDPSRDGAGGKKEVCVY